MRYDLSPKTAFRDEMKTIKTLVLLMSALVASCSVQSSPTKSIRNPAFSSDSKNLFFEYCEDKSCNLIMLSLGEKRLTKLLPAEKSLRFASPGMGQKANQAAAIIIPRKSPPSSTPELVLIDLQKSTFRKLTNDLSQKYAPNFSFDGNKLAYIQSHRDRTWFDGTPRPTGWEVHTIDMATGVSTKKTDFCFYGVSKPFFVPGSDDLVFSGDGPMCNYPDSAWPGGSKGYLKYKERFAEDEIFLLGASRPSLEPWFRNQGHSSNPSVAKNGDILFLSRTNKIDGITKGDFNYDLFLREKDTTRRLTHLKTMIMGNVLSPDSKYAAYISDPERNHHVSLWLLDIEKNKHELMLPAAFEGGQKLQIETVVLMEETRP